MFEHNLAVTLESNTYSGILGMPVFDMVNGLLHIPLMNIIHQGLKFEVMVLFKEWLKRPQQLMLLAGSIKDAQLFTSHADVMQKSRILVRVGLVLELDICTGKFSRW